MKKIALIFGVTGQDGSYLTEFLLNKNYEVHGVKRRASSLNTQRIDHIYHDIHVNGEDFYLHYGDMTDSLNITKLISKINPDEIYNLAAMSHVHVSFEIPEYVANTDAIGTLRILEAVKILNLEKKVKIYQASTSELYGKVQEVPQNENTPFYPRSPYAIAKLYAYWITVNYREAYNIFACNGILFNHESPRRGETFVTSKITRAVSKIALGMMDTLFLGNIHSKRDWGHAKDYVEAMWMILQHNNAEDWVISTGKNYTIKEFLVLSFKFLGIELEFRGEGIEEKAFVKSCSNPNYKIKVGKKVVEIDKRYFRPTEVEKLLGDSSKANKILGWNPQTDIKKLVEEMMIEDLKKLNHKFTLD
tara:strand:- start:790 stop:1872 length:1083 start_codon:yes stop_codon:yes gene_type:complete